MRTGQWFDPSLANLFLRIYDSNFMRILSCLSTYLCFQGVVKKQLVKEYSMQRLLVKRNSRKAWIGVLAAVI